MITQEYYPELGLALHFHEFCQNFDNVFSAVVEGGDTERSYLTEVQGLVYTRIH